MEGSSHPRVIAKAADRRHVIGTIGPAEPAEDVGGVVQGVAERVNLKQFEIQGRKDIHEAENALKQARKAEATLARQLQQAGLEPTRVPDPSEVTVAG